MIIKWHGHACMQLSELGYSVVFDPFAPGYVPGLSDVNAQADKVLCSHGHDDHNYKDAVTIVSNGGNPFKITAVPTWHDEAGGTKRGPNLVHVVDTDMGIRAIHFGDLGHIPDADALKAMARPDVVMIPVGGFYTINADQAKEICDILKPKVIIPMHYRSKTFGYDVIAEVGDFTKLFPTSAVKFYDTDTIEITEDTPAHVAVLKYLG